MWADVVRGRPGNTLSSPTVLGEQDENDFVYHVGVLCDDEPVQLSYGAEATVMQAHLDNGFDPAGEMKAHVYGQLRSISGNELRKIGVFRQEMITICADAGLNTGRKPAWWLNGRYPVHPPYEEQAGGRKERVDPYERPRGRYWRFNCLGVVLRLYKKLSIELLDLDQVPKLPTASLRGVYPECVEKRILEDARTNKGRKYGLRGRLPDGPWELFLPGHAIHSFDRDDKFMRKYPFAPKSGHEYFPRKWRPDMFRNAITQSLPDPRGYYSGQSIEALRCTQEDCDVVVIYFSGNQGLITVPGLNELYDLLEKIAANNGINGVVLTDNNERSEKGRHLSFPGLNIKTEFKAPFEQIACGNEEPMRALLTAGQRVVERIAEFPKPIVGAVAGEVYGGGVEFLAFSHTILGPRSSIALPECTLNIMDFMPTGDDAPDFGDMTLAEPRCLFPGWHGHRSMLFRMIERGEHSEEDCISANESFVFQGIEGRLKASEALAVGIIDEVCDREEDIFDTACKHIHEANPCKPRHLDPFQAPTVPDVIHDRDGLGARACHKSLYENSGTWRELGEIDADLMVQAMRDAMK